MHLREQSQKMSRRDKAEHSSVCAGRTEAQGRILEKHLEEPPHSVHVTLAQSSEERQWQMKLKFSLSNTALRMGENLCQATH
jgi:hypothetical protein